MKRILLSLVFLLFASFTFNLSAQSLDGYKYVYVEPLKYQNGGVDIWGVGGKITEALADKGFVIVTPQKLQSAEIKSNVYALLTCTISHTAVMEGTNSVSFSLTDYKGDVVYSCSGSGISLTFQGDMNAATRNALLKFSRLRYRYDPSKTPKPEIPEVEMSDWNEEKIRDYLNSAQSLDRIEGIYKSVENEALGYYRLGVVKDGYKYKMFVLETDAEFWRPGELKAIFEPANLGLYSVSWYMGNKTKAEVFGTVDSRGVLEVDLTSANSTKSQFLKVYPLTQDTSNPGSSAPKTSPSDIKNKQAIASGTGFILSRDGYIATNAHVVNGNNGVTVDVLNTDGTSSRYIANVIIEDGTNDVAIIKVDDKSFSEFGAVPYSIELRANVGAEVFTIGFPLNSVMGTNYKVSNGIISSKTGINDSVREYQITVPIQPGNSGGPLFNRDGNIVGITTARLNGDYVGTHVENVNYAVKSLYLLNVINSLPSIEDLPEQSSLVGKSMEEQIAILKNYVVLIKIY